MVPDLAFESIHGFQHEQTLFMSEITTAFIERFEGPNFKGSSLQSARDRLITPPKLCGLATTPRVMLK